MDKNIKYNAPPLPFKGNKRGWIKKIREIIETYPDDYTFLDLFGGSGLIAHNIKQIKPNSRVIFNDYEDYVGNRILKIKQTNQVLNEVKNYLHSNKIVKNQKLNSEQKKEVVNILDFYNKKFRGLDVYTFSSCLNFAGQQNPAYDKLLKTTFFNKMIKRDYSATGYLSGVEIVNDCYKNVLNMNLDFNKVLIIADPPYLNTDNTAYNFYEQFKLKDFLDLIRLFSYKNIMFFSCEKSQTIDLLKFYAQSNKQAYKNLEIMQTFERTASVNHNVQYADFLYLCKNL